jgi:hypothetical protein
MQCTAQFSPCVSFLSVCLSVCVSHSVY